MSRSPLSLTDAEYDAVMQAAAPIVPSERRGVPREGVGPNLQCEVIDLAFEGEKLAGTKILRA
jgi:hypothetical protein